MPPIFCLIESHENPSPIGRKEEKPDAKWRLWASNNQSFHSAEMAGATRQMAAIVAAGKNAMF